MIYDQRERAKSEQQSSGPRGADGASAWECADKPPDREFLPKAVRFR